MHRATAEEHLLRLCGIRTPPIPVSLTNRATTPNSLRLLRLACAAKLVGHAEFVRPSWPQVFVGDVNKFNGSNKLQLGILSINRRCEMFGYLTGFDNDVFDQLERTRRQMDRMFGDWSSTPAGIRSLAADTFPAVNVGASE
jgi:hypothetical protein